MTIQVAKGPRVSRSLLAVPRPPRVSCVRLHVLYLYRSQTCIVSTPISSRGYDITRVIAIWALLDRMTRLIYGFYSLPHPRLMRLPWTCHPPPRPHQSRCEPRGATRVRHGFSQCLCCLRYLSMSYCILKYVCLGIVIVYCIVICVCLYL